MEDISSTLRQRPCFEEAPNGMESQDAGRSACGQKRVKQRNVTELGFGKREQRGT